MEGPKRKKDEKMKKYVVNPRDLPTYSPPKHSRTTNRRLLGPGSSGSNRLEVILGEVEYGGQADPHLHPDLEQAFFVLQGKAEVEIEGEKGVFGPEDFIFLPPGTVHRVTPLKGPPLRLLIIYSPPLSSSKTPFEEKKRNNLGGHE
jgi:mannose-6-phosphate isomerase-like protein (cupin superfamily)